MQCWGTRRARLASSSSSFPRGCASASIPCLQSRVRIARRGSTGICCRPGGRWLRRRGRNSCCRRRETACAATSPSWVVSTCPRCWVHAARRCATGSARSEEHTSELQSQFHLVCRLLLEKKKKLILHSNVSIKKQKKNK